MLLAHASLPDTLYWSAPADVDSDFTVEDPLALDYLAQQVGLWLFRGLTTRTGRAQSYAVVLYGLHLAERACDHYGLPPDDETRLRLFERWERFWALATLESRDGSLERGDEDAMRGVRGATRAWFSGARPLPLEFSLISRQSELGSLGAYLSSLRSYGLVFPGTMRPSPAAREIIDAFWDEPGDNQAVPQYEDYSLTALDPRRETIERKHGRITLRKVGQMSRLSRLYKDARARQQARLWHALFVSARDGTTMPLAEQLIAAATDGVDDPAELLMGMLEGRWGSLEPALREKVRAALAFGRLSVELLSSFDRAYGYVHEAGWVADFAETAVAAFPPEAIDALRAACSDVVVAPASAGFRRLAFHGPPMMQLLLELVTAEPTTALDRLLAFHRSVQRSRRGGGSWIRREDDKLVLQVTSYNGYKTLPAFPGFKLGVARGLLRDLGRLR